MFCLSSQGTSVYVLDINNTNNLDERDLQISKCIDWSFFVSSWVTVLEEEFFLNLVYLTQHKTDLKTKTQKYFYAE